jgi:outer membrane murein-binding lipoprotein Lpp
MSKLQIITEILGCKEKEHKMNDAEIMNSLMRIDGRSQSINMIASNRIRDLNIEIERLTTDRDNARQEVCFLLSRNVTHGCDGDTPEFHATARGWCYLLEEDGK